MSTMNRCARCNAQIVYLLEEYRSCWVHKWPIPRFHKAINPNTRHARRETMKLTDDQVYAAVTQRYRVPLYREDFDEWLTSKIVEAFNAGVLEERNSQ